MWGHLRKQFAGKLVESSLTPEEVERIDGAFKHLNSAGYDRWGIDPETVKAALAGLKWFYRYYFRVESIGTEHIPQGRVLLIGNHGGQLPFDAMMIAISCALDANPPRLVRGMVERWVPSLPFVSTFFGRCGQVVGDHRNCRELLENDECVMVFPEGVRGSGKTFQHRYELQPFGTGFIRLALEAKAPIVPVAVIGAEEIYPAFYNWEWLAKKIHAPYVPITPFFPFLGPLGAIPLPSRITLRYAEPIYLEGDPDASDREIERYVQLVKATLEKEIQAGLKGRKVFFFRGSATAKNENPGDGNSNDGNSGGDPKP